MRGAGTPLWRGRPGFISGWRGCFGLHDARMLSSYGVVGKGCVGWVGCVGVIVVTLAGRVSCGFSVLRSELAAWAGLVARAGAGLFLTTPPRSCARPQRRGRRPAGSCLRGWRAAPARERPRRSAAAGWPQNNARNPGTSSAAFRSTPDRL